MILTKGNVGDIYSFHILPYQQIPTKLWNLILVKTNEGEETWHIREYISSAGEINKNSIKQFSGQVNHYELDGTLKVTRILENGNLQSVIYPGSANSRTEYCDFSSGSISVEVCNWEFHSYQNRVDGMWVENCSDETFHYWAYECGNGPAGGSSGGSGSSDPPTGGGGSGNGGSNGADSPIDQLVPVTVDAGPYEAFVLLLNESAQAWYANHPELHSEVESLILTHGKSSDQAFAALELIESLSTMGQLDPPGINAFKVTIRTIARNYYGFVFDQSYYSAIADAVPFNLNDPYIAQEFSIVLAIRATILKEQNPSWSDWRVMWEATRETIQFGLDIAGLVPVFGEVFDLANASIYFLHGDGVNASLSLASAVPGVGWASASVKLGLMRVLKPLGGYTDLKWIKKAGGNIDFGDRNQLRAVLGITDSNVHAHHIIPWNFADHPLVQKAAGVENLNSAFHMNRIENGFPFPYELHLAGHPEYSNKIRQILDLNNNQISSPSDAINFINGLTNHIKDLLSSNQTLNSGQIANLIDYP